MLGKVSGTSCDAPERRDSKIYFYFISDPLTRLEASNRVNNPGATWNEGESKWWRLKKRIKHF